eukprot:s4570_g2.t1
MGRICKQAVGPVHKNALCQVHTNTPLACWRMSHPPGFVCAFVERKRPRVVGTAADLKKEALGSRGAPQNRGAERGAPLLREETWPQMTSGMNLPVASPGRAPSRVITQSPAVGFRSMLTGPGYPVAMVTIARNAKSMCDLQVMASARVRSPPATAQGSPRASPVNQRGRAPENFSMTIGAATTQGVLTPQQTVQTTAGACIAPGRSAAGPPGERPAPRAPFQTGPTATLGISSRKAPPPSVRRTFTNVPSAVWPTGTALRSSSADRKSLHVQIPGTAPTGRQISNSVSQELQSLPFATARRMSPTRPARPVGPVNKLGSSAAAPVRLQPSTSSMLAPAKVPPVSSLVNGRRDEPDEVILRQVTKLQNSLMQQIESTKQQIQRQSAFGAKAVNGLNPQAVAAMTGTAAPRLRAAWAPGMPAAAPAVPAAPASAPASAVPEPEPMPVLASDPVPVQLVEVGSLTLPVNQVKRTEVPPEDGKLADALVNGHSPSRLAAARIQRAWRRRRRSRAKDPEDPCAAKLLPKHFAAQRIQRAWKISRWRRVFTADCKRDLGWLGSLDWLQRHNMLYGTELAETEDLEWWYHQQAGAPLDYEVDPWGCRKLREHLNRMWFGAASPEGYEAKAEATLPVHPAQPRTSQTNPAVPVAQRPQKRASLGAPRSLALGALAAGPRPVGTARSLVAPVAIPMAGRPAPLSSTISPRVEGRHILSASVTTLHRCASPLMSRRPGAPGIPGRLAMSATTSSPIQTGHAYIPVQSLGITTFLAMAYILPVNSGMLSLVIPGKREQLVCATALASFCGCWLMGILSNYPFMLAPGMGTNAFFTFTICLGRGLSYQAAFAAVFVAGCIFITLSITGLRTLMIRLFPEGVKESIGAGVGLFLCFIAFQSSEGAAMLPRRMGLSVADPATLVTLNSLSPSNYDSAKCPDRLGFCRGTEHSAFGYPFGTNGDRSAKDFRIYVPTSIIGSPSLDGLSGALWEGFSAASDPATAATFWTAVATFCYTEARALTFCLADLLDSSGTFFAVAKVAGLTDRRGNLPLARQNMAYLADAIAALFGSMLGVSTVATFAESTAGVADGAKTGDR